MKSSNIGGQAVLEGVMMRNGKDYAVAVRQPDQEIQVEVKEYRGATVGSSLRKIPFIRGIFAFADSLILGVSTLMDSASMLEEEEEDSSEDKTSQESKKDNWVMGATVALSLVIAVGLFMVLPYGLSLITQQFTQSHVVVILSEGVIRFLIFVAYLVLISQMEDIKRTYMYHGAEHKCINCVEHGLELNVENVRKSSRQHKRCGTSFMFFVMIVSIIFCFFITVPSHLLRVVIRILLWPVIAGVSYEVIRLAGNSDNPVMNALSRPGLWFQKLTTKEPDDDMIEVGICSVEAVFDWKAYEDANFGTHYYPTDKMEANEPS